MHGNVVYEKEGERVRECSQVWTSCVSSVPPFADPSWCSPLSKEF